MEITIVRSDPAQHQTDLLSVGILEDGDGPTGLIRHLDERLGGQIVDLLGWGDFRGKEGQTLLLYPEAGKLATRRLLLVGLGKREGLSAERLRRAAATVLKEAVKLRVANFANALHAVDGAAERVGWAAAGRALAEGLELGSYVFDECKSREAEDDTGRSLRSAAILEEDPQRAADMERGMRIGHAMARAENVARTLGNLPGNIATPTYLAERAREIAAAHGMRFTALGPEELEAEGMGALLAVARGSEEEPRLIVLEHLRGPQGGRPVVLVGKGLTFDSGGISIKPAQGMEDMKFDMCGGAAVLAAMQGIAELEIPLNVVALVPAAENLLSGRSMKPGDIVRSHLGKTIEVVNTDAEGRLILADALSYARRFEPEAMVDVATLTGACVIALGNHASGALGNDEALLDEVRAAGEAAGERVWPLPMFDEYREQLKSDYADIKNSGGRTAGAITAAWFLREFVADVPWVHLDVAGTASGDGKLPYQTKGATGAPTRLLIEWVLSRAG